MNVKTTVALVFLLVVSVFGLYVVRSRPVETADANPSPMHASTTARSLIEDALGQVSKIVVDRKNDDQAWTFERVDSDKGATGEWRMTAPIEAKAVRWEVEKIARQLSGLQYEISYGVGEAGGVSAVEAGLEPPNVTVTLTDDEGKSAVVELGNPASATATYVRLAGEDRVCVGKSDLRTLLKSRAIEYRDNQPWTFKPEDATRLEISEEIQGRKADYVFVPVGADWHMESPASAKATAKVSEAVRELSRLRITNWVDDDPGKLAVYGLDAPAVSIRVNVQETKESEEAESESSDSESSDAGDGEPALAQPIIETYVYRLILSDRSPIGEETKVYVGVGDPPVVGTVSKVTADKLKPVMNEWRDMSLTETDLSKASGIEVTVRGETFHLSQREGAWFMEPSGARAEDAAVGVLLNALSKLEAAAFVEGTPEAVSTGLDHPSATLAITLPERSDPLTLRIGEPTDATTRRLTYVRLDEDGPVAKVRTNDLGDVTRGSLSYLDRTVVNLSAGAIARLELRVRVPFADGPLEFAMSHADGTWSMVEPVVAPVRPEAVSALIGSLASLRADSVVGLSGQESAFGLHDPAVRVTIVTDDDQRHSLDFAEHDGGTYAMRDGDSPVYAIPGTVLSQLRAEFRTEAVMSFDAADVASFSISEGGVEHTFERTDDAWRYAAEPDLPLSAKKVEDLLLRVRDLKTERFVRYQDIGGDAPALGLDQPDRTVTLNFQDGSQASVRVSGQGGGSGAPPGRLASIEGAPGVFILSNEMLSRVAVSLDELE